MSTDSEQVGQPVDVVNQELNQDSAAVESAAVDANAGATAEADAAATTEPESESESAAATNSASTAEKQPVQDEINSETEAEPKPASASTDEDDVEIKTEEPAPSINDENAFPALGGLSINGKSTPAQSSWGPKLKLTSKSTSSPINRSSTIQEAFNINTAVSIDISKIEFSKLVNELKKKFDVSIESTLSSVTKNRSFIVTGSAQNVLNAKKNLVRRLTKPVEIKFKIPSKTRSAVIGAGGKNLKPIIESSGAKIDLESTSSSSTPSPNDNFNDDLDDQITVTVYGDADGVQEAKRKIIAIVNEETKHLSTKIKIPDNLLKFVKNYDTKSPELNVSGPKNGLIHLSGLRELVLNEKLNILNNLQNLESNLITETKTIPKQFHQFIDPKEILQKFEVVVEFQKNSELVSFIGLLKNVNESINFARNQSSQFLTDSLIISKAHGGNLHHAKVLASFFKNSDILSKISNQTNTKISIDSYEELASPSTKQISINISAPKESGAQDIKSARTELINQVNKFTPLRVKIISDIGTFYSKKIPHLVEHASKQNNVHVVPFSLLSSNKSNEIFLIALDTEDEDFAPSQDEINTRLSNVDHSLNELRELDSQLKTLILDVKSDKQQFIEGPNGTTLKNLINLVQNGVIIKLHSNGETDSDDQVFIQGSKQDVSKVHKEIESFLKDAENIKDINSFQVETFVPTSTLSRLIGKNGSNMSQLREQFAVEIEVEKNPINEKAKVVITGYKFNVHEAEAHILASTRRFADETQDTLIVAKKYHPKLLGPNGSYVKKLQTKYFVRIQFDKQTDEVVIRGPSRGVAKAKEELKDLLDFEIENGYTKELIVPTSTIALVIGRGGETLNRISASNNVEIHVSKKEEGEDEPKDRLITLTGSRAGLKQAELEILSIVKESKDNITKEIKVDPKYYKFILGSRGVKKSEIIETAGGADYKNYSKLLQIPDSNSDNDIIISSGPKSIVESIISQVSKIVSEKENAITDTILVPKNKRRLIIGIGGTVRKELEEEFSVNIDIPRSESDSEQVKVVGLPENVESAKAKITELTKDNWKSEIMVPVALQLAVSERGAYLRKLRIEDDVEVEHGDLNSKAIRLSSHLPAIPKEISSPVFEEGEEQPVFKFTVGETKPVEISTKEEDSIPWRLIGEDKQVSKVESEIKSFIEQFSKDDTDGYLWVKNPSVFGKVVGPQGSKIIEIRKSSGAQIYVPRSKDKVNNVIYLRGTKESLAKAEKLLCAEIK